MIFRWMATVGKLFHWFHSQSGLRNIFIPFWVCDKAWVFSSTVKNVLLTILFMVIPFTIPLIVSFGFIVELFQKLFRQDLLVASLFRNFLLAERIMRSYNCVPMSCPRLPSTYQHPMWWDHVYLSIINYNITKNQLSIVSSRTKNLFNFRQAWDLAVDTCLSQLPKMTKNGKSFQVGFFFYWSIYNTFY